MRPQWQARRFVGSASPCKAGRRCEGAAKPPCHLVAALLGPGASLPSLRVAHCWKACGFLSPDVPAPPSSAGTGSPDQSHRGAACRNGCCTGQASPRCGRLDCRPAHVGSTTTVTLWREPSPRGVAMGQQRHSFLPEAPWRTHATPEVTVPEGCSAASVSPPSE